MWDALSIELLKRESDVMSLNSEGNEFQSLAAAYLNVDCPMADLTVGRSSNVLSLKFLW